MIDRGVTIIGTGAVGSLLAKALYENDIHIYSLFNRSPEPLKILTEIVNPGYSARFPAKSKELGDLIFITTADNVINKVANDLSKLSDNFSNKIITHCSGVEPSAALSQLKQKGAATAAFHPIQTFTTQSNPDDFNGIYFDLEGDKKAIAYLKKVVAVLNADCFEISPQVKPFLHAAGVIVSNYLIALLDVATAVAEMGDIPRELALEALMPLVQKSLENVEKSKNLNKALSGPITRGDVETVAKHLELLGTNAEIKQLYKILGKRTLEIAQKKENYSKEKEKILAKLFEDE